MREIKFRGWDKFGHPQKQMCEVLEIDFKEQKVLLKGKNKQEFWRLFKDVELMQFTGLKDKKGKDIYEGDIVKIKGWDEECNCEVVFIKGKYELQIIQGKIKRCRGKWYLFDYYWGCEVIGNIYENPELLEGKNEKL